MKWRHHSLTAEQWQELMRGLRLTREYLTPERWTRGAWARGPDAMPVQPLDPRAMCWCFGGAIEVVFSRYGLDALSNVAIQVVCERNGLSSLLANDRATHEEVMRWFDRTMASIDLDMREARR